MFSCVLIIRMNKHKIYTLIYKYKYLNVELNESNRRSTGRLRVQRCFFICSNIICAYIIIRFCFGKCRLCRQPHEIVTLSSSGFSTTFHRIIHFILNIFVCLNWKEIENNINTKNCVYIFSRMANNATNDRQSTNVRYENIIINILMYIIIIISNIYV